MLTIEKMARSPLPLIVVATIVALWFGYMAVQVNLSRNTTQQPWITALDDDNDASSCCTRHYGQRSITTGSSALRFTHPNLVHYIYIYNDSSSSATLNFFQFSSILSAFVELSPERILYHSNRQPDGHYWRLLLKRGAPLHRVPVDFHANSADINGVAVENVSHYADFVKWDALYRLGGLALDFDVFVLNGSALRREQRLGECLLGMDVDRSLARSYGYDAMPNAGFVSCIRHAPFLASWLLSYYKDFRPDDWLFNSGLESARLLASYPYPMQLDWSVGAHYRGDLVSERQDERCHGLLDVRENMSEPVAVRHFKLLCRESQRIDDAKATWRRKTAMHVYHVVHEKTYRLDFAFLRRTDAVIGLVMRRLHFGSTDVTSRRFP